ncbi:hypothetical protein CCACVL1_23885 [Corchorus capsularis]|uniref:Uncharacterized protein n=1 Tax=Corchorus capsularis TaxID=210143 RepID=A0A1R3GRN1_COCAP|nr:hypothetical protein CCACVL1_23885 [Corchorus capsularis]
MAVIEKPAAVCLWTDSCVGLGTRRICCSAWHFGPQPTPY